MECSVVIAIYNRAHLLVETLRSLDAQQIPPTLQWEIIVVDDNSSDRTKETVRRFGETSHVAIRYEFEPRQGQSVARNAGIEAAKDAVILFADNYILPDRTWVSGMSSGGASAAVEEDTPCLLEYPLSFTRRIVGASMAFRREVFEEFGP